MTKVENINCKKCVMCDVKLNEDEESVYSCKKCYNKYPFWIISEKKSEQMTTKITKKNIQWCDRCKTQHKMPRCEFIALPVSEGGHIPDLFYKEY